MSQSERRWGIGGHDAAAIMGVNPWKTKLQVWGEKTGRIPKEDISQKPAVRRGRELETPLLNIYQSVVNRQVAFPSREERFIKHPDHPRVLAVVDAWTTDGETADNKKAVWFPVDAKTVSQFKVDNWSPDPERPEIATQVPLLEMVQLQHYCWTLAAPRASFAVGVVDDKRYIPPAKFNDTLICMGLTGFLWTDMAANADFIAEMEKRVLEMIWHIENDKQPPIEPQAKDKEVAREILGAEKKGKVVELGDQGQTWVDVIHEQNAGIEAHKDCKSIAEAKLELLLGDAEVGLLPGPGKKKVQFKTPKTPDRKVVFDGAEELIERLESIVGKDPREYPFSATDDELYGWCEALRGPEPKPRSRQLYLPKRPKGDA